MPNKCCSWLFFSTIAATYSNMADIFLWLKTTARAKFNWQLANFHLHCSMSQTCSFTYECYVYLSNLFQYISFRLHSFNIRLYQMKWHAKVEFIAGQWIHTSGTESRLQIMKRKKIGFILLAFLIFSTMHGRSRIDILARETFPNNRIRIKIIELKISMNIWLNSFKLFRERTSCKLLLLVDVLSAIYNWFLVAVITYK